MEFGVQVLTTGFWPTFKQTDIALPPDMQRCQAVFKEYYETKTSHRRLTWIHSLGQATVRESVGREWVCMCVRVCVWVCGEGGREGRGALGGCTLPPVVAVQVVEAVVATGRGCGVSRGSRGCCVRSTSRTGRRGRGRGKGRCRGHPQEASSPVLPMCRCLVAFESHTTSKSRLCKRLRCCCSTRAKCRCVRPAPRASVLRAAAGVGRAVYVSC
jgi:hypothetical protein